MELLSGTAKADNPTFFGDQAPPLPPSWGAGGGGTGPAGFPYRRPQQLCTARTRPPIPAGMRKQVPSYGAPTFSCTYVNDVTSVRTLVSCRSTGLPGPGFNVQSSKPLRAEYRMGVGYIITTRRL
eukprot:3767344-Prymnesium_polylepis.1